MGIHKFRRRYITKHLNELVKSGPLELLKGAEELAKQMNTSISKMVSNYIGKMEFEEKETKETYEDGEYIVKDGIHYKKIINQSK